MSCQQTAHDVLERQYLEMRCGILTLAADLDRIERSQQASAVLEDPRMQLIRQGIAILASNGTDRAERVQLLFSDEYVEGWNASS